MIITLEQLNEVLQGLPVGYYLNRDIEVGCDDKTSCSYYDEINDKIVVSLNQVNAAMRYYGELNKSVIRGLLYHEISHVILTSKNMTDYLWSDKINIFEDERIETLLKDYYMEVDFKNNVRLINNWNGPRATNEKELFYEIVRFDCGPKELIELKNKIIEEFKDIDATTDYGRCREYNNRVYYLYNKVVEYCNKMRQAEEEQKIPQEQDGDNNNNDNTGADNNTTDNNNVEDNKDNENDGENTSNENDDEERTDDENELSDDPADGRSLTESEVADKIDKAFDFYGKKYENKRIDELVKKLIDNKRKRGHFSPAIDGYAGALNLNNYINKNYQPRNDYKYWEHKNENGLNKRYSKIKLNLFVDKSGSFSRSENKINSIIKSLNKLEKIEKDFEFDVVAMDTEAKILPKDNRKIITDGGTNMSPSHIVCYNKVQEKDKANYNIVVFDGIAYDCEYEKRLFKAFNHWNCTVIVDDSNAPAVRKYCKGANVIIVDCDYAEHLEDNVCKALRLAIR